VTCWDGAVFSCNLELNGDGKGESGNKPTVGHEQQEGKKREADRASLGFWLLNECLQHIH